MTGISVEIRPIGLRWAMIALAFLATVINYLCRQVVHQFVEVGPGTLWFYMSQ